MLLPYLFLALFSLSIVVDSQCYFPDKSNGTNLVPCGAGPSAHCCGSDSICMDNGYCMDVKHQPFTLSRAGCTDPDFGTGCPQMCTSVYPNAGCAIVLYHVDGTHTTYCCNAVISKGNNAAGCFDGPDPFTLPAGQPIFGRALLANTTSNQDSNNNDNSGRNSKAKGNSHGTDIAIGVGVGVPLGVLFFTALGWAIFERKKRYSVMMSAGAGAAAGAYYRTQVQPGYGDVVQQPVMVVQPQELETTGRRPQELDSRAKPPPVELEGRQR